MTQITSKPRYGETVLSGRGLSPDFQLYFDEIEEKLNTFLLGASVRLPVYTVATLPDVVEGGLIYVSDESGGAVVAFGDGTDWRRVTDRAIVS